MRLEHIHKYQRVFVTTRRVVRQGGKRTLERVGGYEVFKCMHDGCTHFKPRALVIGCKSVCWKCGGELILNMENTTLQKPTHMNCRNTKEKAS